MMNKMRSARLHLVKFLFVVPLAAVLLVAFRDKYADWWRPAAGQVYVNAAGIVISPADKTPVAGVTVREEVTGMETRTDANGYYKLHIPVTKDTMRIRLDYSKEGYDSDWRLRVIPNIKESFGVLDVSALKRKSSVPTKDRLIVTPNTSAPAPVDPGYEDAKLELQRVVRADNELRYFDLKKSLHPEIGLCYLTEDQQRCIVFHRDGTIERFGYPGQPPVEDMDRKYGTLLLMSGDSHLFNRDYLSRWAEISARAAKEFHTGSTPIKEIIFPGDSRVIAVPLKGDPEVYDMDNGARNERTAFENLYGRLPGCVPPPGFNSDAMGKEGASGPAVNFYAMPLMPGQIVSGSKGNGRGGDAGRGRDTGWLRDTGRLRDTALVRDRADSDPVGRDRVIRRSGGKDTSRIPMRISDIPVLDMDVIHGHILYVLDGEKMPAGWELSDVKADNILSIDVVKGPEAVRLFGSRGANGVLAITTKKYELNRPLNFQLRDSLHLWNGDRYSNSLFILDGQEVSREVINALDPTKILNIEIHNDDEVTRRYVEKGKHGVIIVTVKHEVVIYSPAHQPLTAAMVVNGQPWTITADTLRVSQPLSSGFPSP